ncbi:MAG: SseB family protein [Eubacteriales bacterium]|nr:SseB family protein [Eubacteriales bacterium]
MTKERQEALLKMLTAGDFEEKNYEELTTEEMIILRNSANNMIGKNPEDEKMKFFFTKREEFFRHLVMRRLQSMPEMFVAFSRATSLPYVYCDPETCNDQIWIFTIEALAKKVAADQAKEKNALMLVKFENKDFLKFYLSLFNMGVNELVIDRSGNTMNLDLDKLVKQPDVSELPEEKRPIVNSALVLTCAYFAQELRKPLEKGEDGKVTRSEASQEALKELEEEMLVNFRRGKFILPVILPEGEEKITPQNIQIPYMKMKNGDMYQPICTDLVEFKKMNQDGKMKGLNVPYDRLPAMMGKEVKGLLLNPGSIRMAFPKANIK